jgi:hypothetical protein
MIIDHIKTLRVAPDTFHKSSVLREDKLYHGVRSKISVNYLSCYDKNGYKYVR